MSYEIKAYSFNPDGNALNLRFLCKVPSLDDAIEFISRVSFEDYDRVTVLPEDYKEIKNGI